MINFVHQLKIKLEFARVVEDVKFQINFALCLKQMIIERRGKKNTRMHIGHV